jgi:hypothetical protein
MVATIFLTTSFLDKNQPTPVIGDLIAKDSINSSWIHPLA